MKNILYIDDYINYFDKRNEKIISFKPYKETLKAGKVINSKKFINSFLKLKKEYKLKEPLLNEKIIFLINSTYSYDDRIKIKELLEELNYRKIEIINEVNLLKINKKNMFINFNETYFNIYYLENDKVKLLSYEKNNVNNSLVFNIIKILNKENIIVFGKRYQEIINILKKTKNNYYFYEESVNLFIELMKNKSV